MVQKTAVVKAEMANMKNWEARWLSFMDDTPTAEKAAQDGWIIVVGMSEL